MTIDLHDAMNMARIGIIQRVCTNYRQPFFDRLAATTEAELRVFAGEPLKGESTRTSQSLYKAKLCSLRNHRLNTPAGPLYWQTGLLLQLKDFTPDVLVFEANPRLISNWQVLKWCRANSCTAIGWGLGMLHRDCRTIFSELRKRYMQRVVLSFDAMIAYSSKAAADFAALGMPKERIFIAGNATDTAESFTLGHKLRKDLSWIRGWREAHGIDLTSKVVLFVGQLTKKKRLDLLIKACAPLLGKCQLLIVGDGSERSRVESLASPYFSRIKVLGHLSGEDLARCFVASDVFVLPGLGGLSMQQAMSYAKPVVVSFADGTEMDLVRDGKNGLYFREGDVIDLRTKINFLLDNPSMLNDMGAESFRIVKQECNLDLMCARFANAISHCLSLRGFGHKSCVF